MAETEKKAECVPEEGKQPNVKYDWYQTDSHVTITVLLKNIHPDNVNIKFNEHELDAHIKEDQDFRLHLDLAHAIIPEQCNYKVLSSKIEIKLKKAVGTRWLGLQSEPKSSSSKGRNWDKVVGELEEDKSEGEAALNALFQKIYSEGSDEVKKAMNKSFLESGGTVLSTNWSEVAKDKVNIKPPDGMEWRKWEQ